MMTAKEIIEASLTELGILVAGDSPGTADLAWCLGKLNRFLNTLSADGLNLHYRVEESFSLVAGTPDYTIGSGATWDTARPNVIERAFIRDSNNHDHPVEARPIFEYWLISEKTSQSRPKELFYAYAVPYGIIYLYYTPSSSESLYIVSQKLLTTYANANIEVVLPVEYEDTLVLNLAIRIAPRYGIATSRELNLAAKEAYNNLKARNLVSQMRIVPVNITGARGAYNVDAG